VEIPGGDLEDGWVALKGGDVNVLIVFPSRPKALRWVKNSCGGAGLTAVFDAAPARAVVLAMPQGTSLDARECGFWARALRRYPVAVSECVRHEESGARRCALRYRYLDLTGGVPEAGMACAPVPMLASFAVEAGNPHVTLDSVVKTGYRCACAPYRVKRDADTVAYRTTVLDRSKVQKGFGELFARQRVERNVHGGLGEREMFERAAGWGFDHCRYAIAFNADWDLPLVSFTGGPISEDPRLWERLDALVANCNAAGMQMMLCSFTEIRSRTWKAHPEWQKTIVEFWRRIAARYARLPAWAISYDFFNEPAYMNIDHYREIMRELTAVVRSVDKTHTIVWEPGDGWAQPQWCWWLEPVEDDNVLYSFHHYGKHWGYAYDEYYPGYQATYERTQVEHWVEAILFGIEHDVPIHCGEFGISMLQPARDGARWLNDYLTLFERFGIGWNWWNYSGDNIYRTGLACGDRVSPYVPILRAWAERSGWGASRREEAVKGRGPRNE
jgi:hypothetical protein